MPESLDPGAAVDAPPAEAVLEAVHRVMHRVRSQQQRALREAPQGLAHMEARVLGFFARHPGATPGDLAAHSGRDKAQLTRLLATLRERGLLDATPDSHDRRSVRLTLSSRGRRVQQALAQVTRQVAEQAAAGLSAQERRSLVRLLQRLDDNLAGLP